MSLQSLRQLSWLRTALAALLLCFALGTIAYAGHHHQQGTASAHVVCEFCAGLGTVIDAPPSVQIAGTVPLIADSITVPKASFIALRSVGVAQARAPPVVLN